MQVEAKFLETKDILATKEGIFNVKGEIAKLHVEIKEEKAELHKWMIVLFAPFYSGMIVFLVKQYL